MKKLLCKLLFVFILLTAMSSFPTQSKAQLLDWSSPGCTYDSDGDSVATLLGVECIVRNIFTIAITLVGLGVFFMIIFGAYQLLGSGGDPKSVAAGRATITYALGGLVLALSTWFIINLIATFTGTNTGTLPGGFRNLLKFNTQVDDCNRGGSCTP